MGLVGMKEETVKANATGIRMRPHSEIKWGGSRYFVNQWKIMITNFDGVGVEINL